MEEARRKLAETIFNKAADLEPAQRERCVEEACGTDTQLAAQVRRLLANLDDSTFLATPAVERSDAPPRPGSSGSSGWASGHASEPRLPEQLGGYSISAMLGSGGMGVVYEAVQLRTNRPVALKVIRPGLASRALLRRFEHEVWVLGQLEHP